jgi:hypothetical protein
MHPHSFESVREQLLRAGIAPRHVNRYVTELREHMTDLVARERAAGLDAREAESKARTILGSDIQLVQAALNRGAPRSWAAKVPWAVFGLLPAAVVFTVSAIVAMTMFRLLMPVREILPGQMPGGYQTLIVAATILTGYVVGPLLAALCIAIALRQRLSSAWVWVGLAVIALFSGLFAFHAPSAPGDMYRAVQLVTENGRVNGPATLLWVGLRASVLFGFSALAYRALKRRSAIAA